MEFSPLIFCLSCLFLTIQGRTWWDSSPGCHCLPGQPCFPSADVWSAFNEELGGRLLQARPAASPCHAPNYDNSTCQAAKTNWKDALWRADQVGASQHPQWETYRTERCLIDSNETCSQGAVPVYAVNLKEPSDVGKAFAFSAKHNIRLIVKNTGHDYLGRSNGVGSLSIWTHHLKSIEFTDNFRAVECPREEGERPISAVTVGAGVQFGELYKAAAEKKKIVVGAFSASVGAAGGYVGGGGHSVLGPSYGLPADNILQIEVVTPSGYYYVVNKCQSQDLFWALRGGGPATYGVILKVTYKTFPAPQSIANIHLDLSSSNSSSLREFIAEYARTMPSIADKKYGGTFVALPDAAHLSYILPDGNPDSVSQDWKGLTDFAATLPGLTLHQRVAMFPNFYSFFNATLCQRFRTQCTDVTAENEILSSRLLPRSLFLTSPGKIADAYMEVLTRNSTGGARNFVLTMSVGGGAGATSGNSNTTALNPAWRQTLWHTILQASWEDDASDEEIAHKFADITAANKAVRDLAPESGSYLNEADFNEPEWQKSFYGVNYDKLLKIKRSVDPLRLLGCTKCVGSEDWNSDFTCRNPSKSK